MGRKFPFSLPLSSLLVGVRVGLGWVGVGRSCCYCCCWIGARAMRRGTHTDANNEDRNTSRKWPVWKATLLALTIACVFAGVEAALILTLRVSNLFPSSQIITNNPNKPLYLRGHETPIFIIGIIAAILLALGLLPPYGEMYKRHGRVVGINWIFLAMDWSGAFFSLMAVVTQNTFDVLGGVLYIICALLELGIFGSHLIWLARTRKLRKELQTKGKTFDEVAAEKKEKGEEWEWAERELDLRWLKLKFWERKTDENGGSRNGHETTATIERDLEKQESERDQDQDQDQDNKGLRNDGTAGERDLEKQQDDHHDVTAAGQQDRGFLNIRMMMAKAKAQKKPKESDEENTGASTPTMVDRGDDDREVNRTLRKVMV